MSGAIAARDSVRRHRDRSATWAFWAFVTPLLVGLLIFTFIPIIWGFLLSFDLARGTVALGSWAGLANYASLLQDPSFRSSLLTIVVFTAFIVPTTYAIALGLALLVNRAKRGRGFFRTVFFIPTAVSYVAASLVWKMEIFSGVFGLADQVLGIFHIPGPNWIAGANPPLYWLVLVTVRLWLQLGFYMIVFLAGLQEIPQHLYEAAWVDGARRGWPTFRHITLPQLRNTSVAVVLLLFVNAFQAFDEFYNIMGNGLSSGGNAILARPPLVYLYSVALSQQDYGRGAAGAFILSALILLVTVGQGRIAGFGRAQS
jgi:multiple sugar transport system permease protein